MDEKQTYHKNPKRKCEQATQISAAKSAYPGAVRKRIKTLTDAGTIRKTTVKVGRRRPSHNVACDKPANPTLEVSKIQAIPNVKQSTVTSEYDIVIITGMNVTEVNGALKIRRVKE